MFFLVWNAKDYYKRRNELRKGHYKIIDRLAGFGIKIDKHFFGFARKVGLQRECP